MVRTSDVISGGGGDPAYRTGKEVKKTISGPGTITAATYFDNSGSPTILRQNTRYGRDRIPDTGLTAGTYWNVEVDQASLPYYIEASTALTDGTRPLVACLLPGAKGFFEWDGTEWWWNGVGEAWWPMPKNDGKYVSTTNTGGSSQFCFFEDATIGGGIISMRTDTSASPQELNARVIPFNTDGTVGTPGTTATHAETNNVNNPYIFPLSNTVFIVVFNESTTSHTRAIVLTRTAGSTSLIFGSSSTITKSGSTQATNDTLSAFRGHQDKFIYVHGGVTVDASNYSEYAYCTIAGTGSGAAITRNTGVHFGRSGFNHGNTLGRQPMEDPIEDGVFWASVIGDDANNNQFQHITRFNIVGTTPTITDQWLAPNATHSANNGFMYDFKDGNILFYDHNDSAFYGFDLSDDEPDIVAAMASNAFTTIREVNGTEVSNMGGFFGGVFGFPAETVNARFTQAALRGGSNQVVSRFSSFRPAYPDDSSVDVMSNGKMVVPGTLPQIPSANGYLSGLKFSRGSGSMNAGHSGLENHGLLATLREDTQNASLEQYALFEIGSATRY